jgi:hypothetical protein
MYSAVLKNLINGQIWIPYSYYGSDLAKSPGSTTLIKGFGSTLSGLLQLCEGPPPERVVLAEW